MKEIDPSEREYYSIAAASGFLTGTLSCIKWNDIDFEKINEWKPKEWDKYVVTISKLIGYKKNDVKGAKRCVGELEKCYMINWTKQIGVQTIESKNPKKSRTL